MLLTWASTTSGEARRSSRVGHRCRCAATTPEETIHMALTFQSPHNWDLDEAWRSRAACSEVDPDLFFPVGVTGPALSHIAAAKAVCEGCDVRGDCLEF